MKGYVILEQAALGAITEESKLDYVGFAKSIRDAEKAIRDDVRDNFEPDSINEDFDEYCVQYMICEIHSIVQPVPKVSVSIGLTSPAKGE